MLNKIVQAYQEVLTDKEKGYSTNVTSLDEMLANEHRAKQNQE